MAGRSILGLFCWHLFVCLRESYGNFNLEVGGHKRNRVFVIIVPICRTQASPQSEQKQTNLQWQNVKFLFRRPFPKRACKRSFFSPSCFFLPSYITSNQNSRLRYDGERRKRMSSFDPPQPPSDRQKSPKCLRWRLLLLLFSFWKFRVGVEGSFGGGGEGSYVMFQNRCCCC